MFRGCARRAWRVAGPIVDSGGGSGNTFEVVYAYINIRPGPPPAEVAVAPGTYADGVYLGAEQCEVVTAPRSSPTARAICSTAGSTRASMRRNRGSAKWPGVDRHQQQRQPRRAQLRQLDDHQWCRQLRRRRRAGDGGNAVEHGDRRFPGLWATRSPVLFRIVSAPDLHVSRRPCSPSAPS